MPYLETASFPLLVNPDVAAEDVATDLISAAKLLDTRDLAFLNWLGDNSSRIRYAIREAVGMAGKGTGSAGRAAGKGEGRDLTPEVIRAYEITPYFTEEWIASRVGAKVAEIKPILRRLEQLGFIVPHGRGAWHNRGREIPGITKPMLGMEYMLRQIADASGFTEEVGDTQTGDGGWIHRRAPGSTTEVWLGRTVKDVIAAFTSERLVEDARVAAGGGFPEYGAVKLPGGAVVAVTLPIRNGTEAWIASFLGHIRDSGQPAKPPPACKEKTGGVCEVPARSNPRRNPADGGPPGAARSGVRPDATSTATGAATDCKGEIVFDSEGRRYPVTYKVIAAKIDGSTVVTSHHPQTFAWQTKAPLNYPVEFQTRDLGDQNESAKINTIAQGLQPERLLHKHIDATLGPPVVWPHDGRYYVLGGNGRAIAFLRAPAARYAAYLADARCRWDCFPDQPAPEGSRWLLVREVHAADGGDLSLSAAIQLAAASQRSTAAGESRIGEAIGQVRSMRITVENVPVVYQLEPVIGENMADFRQDHDLPFGLADNANNVFYNRVFRALDPARATAASNNPALAAEILENVFVGLLPPEALKPSLYEDRRQVDALFGAAPAILTSHLLTREDKIPAEYDLWIALREAVPLFEWLADSNPTVKTLVRELQRQSVQTSLVSSDSGGERARRSIEAPPLAWALALAMWGAAKTLAPEGKVVEQLKPYFTALADPIYRPGGGGGGLFGGMMAQRPDEKIPPGDLLGRNVPNYKQVAEVLAAYATRRNPDPLRHNRSAAHLATLREKADSWRGSGDAPVISWFEPVTAANIKRFQTANPHFYAWAVKNMPHDDWATAAETVQGAILRALPPNLLDVKRRGAAGWDATTLLWGASTLLTVAQAVARGEADPKYEPGAHPPDALNLRGADGRKGLIAWADKALASDPRQAKLWNPGKGSAVQTILFARDRWRVKAAREWLAAHGYEGRDAGTTDQHHRFRQHDPGGFQRGSFRTIPFGEDTGIQAVIGRVK